MAQAFAATHGVEVADIIMEHLPPEGWSELATKTDVATQGQLLRSEFESQGRLLRSEFESQGRLLRRDLESQGQVLRSEFGEKMSELRRELGDVISKGFKEQRRWIIGTAFGFLAMLTGVISATVVLIR